MFCVNTAINNKDVDAIVDRKEENEEIIDVKEFSDKISDTPFSTSLQQIISTPIGDRKDENDKTKKLLEELFKKVYEDNEVVKEIMDAKAHSLRELLTTLTKKGIKLSIRDLKIKSQQFYVKNRMYVPENEILQLHLLQ